MTAGESVRIPASFWSQLMYKRYLRNGQVQKVCAGGCGKDTPRASCRLTRDRHFRQGSLPSLPSFVAVWLFLFPVLGTIGNKSPVDRRFYGNGGIAFWFGDCRFSCGDGASVRWGWTAAHDQLGHQFVALRVPW